MKTLFFLLLTLTLSAQQSPLCADYALEAQSENCAILIWIGPPPISPDTAVYENRVYVIDDTLDVDIQDILDFLGLNNTVEVHIYQADPYQGPCDLPLLLFTGQVEHRYLIGSPITCDYIDGPLPLTYIKELAGKETHKGVELTWTTTQEVGTKEFMLQRLLETWVTVGVIPSENTLGVHFYSYLDKPLKGSWLYRLKQIDLDGGFEYSRIVEVSWGASFYSSILTDDYYVPEDFILLDMSGRVIDQGSNRYLKGSLPTGVYILRLSTQTIKLIR